MLIFLISACTVTGPAEDDWDLEQKEGRIDLFGKQEESDNRGIVLFDSSKKSPEKSGTLDYTANKNIGPPAIDQKSFEDFKAWRRASQPSSSDYQEYQDWKAYQQYRRFKAQQQ